MNALLGACVTFQSKFDPDYAFVQERSRRFLQQRQIFLRLLLQISLLTNHCRRVNLRTTLHFILFTRLAGFQQLGVTMPQADGCKLI